MKKNNQETRGEYREAQKERKMQWREEETQEEREVKK